MTTTDIIKMLVDRERIVAKNRNHALARGNWTKAIECDAVEKAYVLLRTDIANQEHNEASDLGYVQPPVKPEVAF